jgi:hypothetical protein
MSRVERIGDRLPRFYNWWNKQSAILSLISSFSLELDGAEEEITKLMKSHWVDIADGDDLDMLGMLLRTKRIAKEDDHFYRLRLKRAISEYMGGGTVNAITEALRALIHAEQEDDVRIIENPELPVAVDLRVMSGNTWNLGSNSILNATPTIILSFEGEGEVVEPVIENVDRQESVAYKGTMKSGQKLVIMQGRSELDGKDVTEQVKIVKFPQLMRSKSVWKYSESMSELLGVFDSAKFDEHTFTTGIPFVNIRFEWVSQEPASFEVHIKSKALKESELTLENVEEFVNLKRAAGVKSTVKII